MKFESLLDLTQLAIVTFMVIKRVNIRFSAQLTKPFLQRLLRASNAILELLDIGISSLRGALLFLALELD